MVLLVLEELVLVSLALLEDTAFGVACAARCYAKAVPVILETAVGLVGAVGVLAAPHAMAEPCTGQELATTLRQAAAAVHVQAHQSIMHHAILNLV